MMTSKQARKCRERQKHAEGIDTSYLGIKVPHRLSMIPCANYSRHVYKDRPGHWFRTVNYQQQAVNHKTMLIQLNV